MLTLESAYLVTMEDDDVHSLSSRLGLPPLLAGLFALLVRLLNDGQLGVLVPGGQPDIRWIPGPVQHQRPFPEPTGLFDSVRRVETNLKGPASARVLAPSVRRHEGPFRESIPSVVIVRPAAQDHRTGNNIE